MFVQKFIRVNKGDHWSFLYSIQGPQGLLIIWPIARMFASKGNASSLQYLNDDTCYANKKTFKIDNRLNFNQGLGVIQHG